MSNFFRILSTAVLLAAFISCEKTPVDDGKTPEEPEFVRYQTNQQCPINIVKGYLNFNILLPNDYNENAEKRYPVVYMLHGYGDNINTWEKKGWKSHIQSLETAGLPPMIYVFPTGWDSYYSNTFDDSRKYMDMFTQEFVPFIDQTYRTIADREHRAVMGYSMGGFGAMVLPLKNPDMFGISVPLSMSFRTDEQYMSEPAGGWDYQWGKIFGGKGLGGEARLTDYYKEHCPFYQFVPENKETLSQVKWFFHCGDDEEQLLIANDNLHVQLRNYGYDHEFRISNGGHTESYWRTAAKETLPWISHVMNDGGEWSKIMNDVTPKSAELNEDGTFSSKAFKEAEEKDGVAFYMTHKGMKKDMIDNIIGLISQNGPTKQFMILPCDLEVKSLNDWISYYTDKYEVGKEVSKSQVIAFGETGREVWSAKDKFCKYYFVDADLAEDETTITAEAEKFYFITQSDDGVNYKDMNALYRACMSAIDHIDNRNFEYRMRNGISDPEKETLLSAKSVADNLKF